MKIVINNTKTKTNEAAELWKHLEAKWNTRNTGESGFSSVCKKSRTTLLHDRTENKSDQQVYEFSKP